MEVYNFPLRVVVSLWLIQRIKHRGFISTFPEQHLTGQIGHINDVMRITDPFKKVGRFERWLRNIVSDYRDDLHEERDKLVDMGVEVVGFIPKGDK